MPAEQGTPSRVTRWLAGAGVLVAVCGVLAWFDVLPGGWRLHRVFEPAADQRARTVALHASARLREFAAADPAASEGAVVFVGASNIERLNLAELFPARRVVNRGIAGATAEELTAFVPQLALPAHPAGLVIHAGANDWRGLGLPADAIAPRVEKLLVTLAERTRPAPILLVGLLPERGASPELVRDRAEIDEALSAAVARARAAGSRVTFLRVARPPISSADGTLAEECSSDREHLNAAGAQQLARWIASEGGAVGRFLAP